MKCQSHTEIKAHLKIILSGLYSLCLGVIEFHAIAEFIYFQ